MKQAYSLSYGKGDPTRKVILSGRNYFINNFSNATMYEMKGIEMLGNMMKVSFETREECPDHLDSEGYEHFIAFQADKDFRATVQLTFEKGGRNHVAVYVAASDKAEGKPIVSFSKYIRHFAEELPEEYEQRHPAHTTDDELVGNGFKRVKREYIPLIGHKALYAHGPEEE